MMSDVCKPVRDLALQKIAVMLRSKLGYFDSCFTAREVLILTYEHQCKILASDSISAYV